MSMLPYPQHYRIITNSDCSPKENDIYRAKLDSLHRVDSVIQVVDVVANIDI